ncbi:MAG: hypothetical protein Q7J32_14560 [Sphingomonadaceae bacterium]|nr:hypothetical protein [Sphingomonadaceae bacterium]
MPGLLAAALAAGSLAAGCTELPGAREMLAAPGVDFVLVGEYHGTVEMPAVARDIACAVAETRRPLAFAVELTSADQPALDRFMKSNGSPAARAALLASPGWAEKGGRTTAAIADMLDAVRRIGKRHPTTLVAFDTAPEPSGTSAKREAAMAAALTAARTQKDTLVVALTGLGHADKTSFTSPVPPYPSAGKLLPGDRTLSLAFARPGGQYWGCSAPNGDTARGCTAYDMPSREPVAPRGIRLDKILREGFDGVYMPGQAYTASRPARTES